MPIVKSKYLNFAVIKVCDINPAFYIKIQTQSGKTNMNKREKFLSPRFGSKIRMWACQGNATELVGDGRSRYTNGQPVPSGHLSVFSSTSVRGPYRIHPCTTEKPTFSKVKAYSLFFFFANSNHPRAYQYLGTQAECDRIFVSQ